VLGPTHPVGDDPVDRGQDLEQQTGLRGLTLLVEEQVAEAGGDDGMAV
jgi:hypothetical protein